MRRILMIISVCLLTISMLAQKRISHEYDNVSLSDALSQLAEQQTDYAIMFLYNELEDFRITTTVSRKSLPDAIQQMIGFYPIRMIVDTSNPKEKKIFVECTHKTDRHLTGTIINEQGQPVAYANVAILNPADSTLLSGGVSNESGYFAIPYEQPTVLARISYIGYKTEYRLCNQCDMGTIRMLPDIYIIKGVVVKGDRGIMKAENGRLVYDMPQLMQILPADDAYEALTRIPGVTDNGSGLMFTGRPVTLIINGKPTTLDASQVIERLKQMPASQVAKAEIMTAAPAKYHVRGMAINIVTMDYAGTNQMSGQVQGTWNQNKYGRGYAKGTFLYNHGKLGLDISYSFADGDNYGKVEHEANHPLGTTRKAYSDKTQQHNSGSGHDWRIGMDYAFADNHRLSAAYTGKWSADNGTNTTTGTSSSIQKFRMHDYLHNVDANYQAPFGLQLNASYTNYQNPRIQQLNGTMYDAVRNLTVDSRQRISKWLFTADLEHSLKNGWGLSYGVKAQFTNNNSFQTTLNQNHQEIPDATSRVDYDERIMNAYAGISKQIGKAVSLEGSVTAEQYHATLWDDWRIYPTLNAMWNVNTNHTLNLSFSSEAVYPSYWSTMSSIHYTSAYTEIWGNPDLKPASSYDLNLMWQIKRRYTIVAFACFQPDYFVQLPYQPSDRMAVVMKETNFDYSNYFGLQTSARINIGQWLNGNVNVTGLYRHDKSNQFFDLPFNRHCLAAIVSGNVSARLSTRHNLTLMVTPFLQSKAIQGVYDIDPMFSLTAMLRWTSLDGKWSVVIKGTNMTNSHASTRSIAGNQDYTMRIWMQNAEASLTAIYRIGGFKEKKTKAVDTSRMGY